MFIPYEFQSHVDNWKRDTGLASTKTSFFSKARS